MLKGIKLNRYIIWEMCDSSNISQTSIPWCKMMYQWWLDQINTRNKSLTLINTKCGLLKQTKIHILNDDWLNRWSLFAFTKCCGWVTSGVWSALYILMRQLQSNKLIEEWVSYRVYYIDATFFVSDKNVINRNALEYFYKKNYLIVCLIPVNKGI